MNESEWLSSSDPAAMLHALLTPWGTKLSGGGSLPQCDAVPSPRKLRLFACACCRLVWDRLTDSRSRRAVEVAERYADGEATAGELYEANQGASQTQYEVWARAGGIRRPDVKNDGWFASLWAYAVSLERPVEYVVGCNVGLLADAVPPALQAALLRCIVGNPWRPVALCGAGSPDAGHCSDCLRLRTPTVLALAREAYTLRGEDGLLDPHRLGVLADALEEAGCGDVCERCGGSGIEQRVSYDDYETFACGECDGAGRLPHPLLAHLRSEGPHVRGCHAVDLLLGRE